MSKNNICNSDSLLLDMKPMQIKTKTARNTPPRICHLCLAEYGTLEGGLGSQLVVHEVNSKFCVK